MVLRVIMALLIMQHFRVIHSKNEFASGNNHINGIKNFGGLCKIRLAKFRGMNEGTFYLHIADSTPKCNSSNKNFLY